MALSHAHQITGRWAALEADLRGSRSWTSRTRLRTIGWAEVSLSQMSVRWPLVAA